jgi:hypothetical protein
VCDTFTFPVLQSCTPVYTASLRPALRTAAQHHAFSFHSSKTALSRRKLQLVTSSMLVTVSKGSGWHVGDLHNMSSWQSGDSTWAEQVREKAQYERLVQFSFHATHDNLSASVASCMIVRLSVSENSLSAEKKQRGGAGNASYTDHQHQKPSPIQAPITFDGNVKQTLGPIIPMPAGRIGPSMRSSKPVLEHTQPASQRRRRIPSLLWRLPPPRVSTWKIGRRSKFIHVLRRMP